MTTKQVLQRAMKRIEKGWCKFRFAENAKGHQVSVNSRKAVKWCAAGACGMDCSYTPPSSEPALNKLREAIDSQYIGEWNNTQPSKRPILAAFRKAIKACD